MNKEEVLLNASDLEIGQYIEAAIWFRCGYHGDNKDYAVIRGTICRIMECYNRIQVNVLELITGRHPGRTIWIDCTKNNIEIIK